MRLSFAVVALAAFTHALPTQENASVSLIVERQTPAQTFNEVPSVPGWKWSDGINGFRRTVTAMSRNLEQFASDLNRPLEFQDSSLLRNARKLVSANSATYFGTVGGVNLIPNTQLSDADKALVKNKINSIIILKNALHGLLYPKTSDQKVAYNQICLFKDLTRDILAIIGTE